MSKPIKAHCCLDYQVVRKAFRHRRVASLIFCAFVFLFSSQAILRAETSSIDGIQPFLKQYCSDCHGDGADEGEFELAFLKRDLTDAANFDAWQLVYDRIKNGVMPPPEAEKPLQDEVLAFLKPLAHTLGSVQQTQRKSLGRVTARRLNALEFETTLSDLLRTPLDIADLLPTDAKADGFSTVGSALNISSVQMQAYLEAIDSAIDQAVRFTEQPETQKFRLSLLNNYGYMLTYRAQHPTLPVVDGMLLFAREKMSYHHALWGQYVVPRTGKYRIKVSAYKVNSQKPIALTMRAGGSGHKESLQVKHRLLEHFEVDSKSPEIFEWEGELLRGHFLHLHPSELPIKRFTKIQRKDGEKYEQIHWKGPGVCVQWLEIEGPIIEAWPPEGQQVLFGGVATEPIPGTRNLDPNEQLHSPPIIPADPIILPTDWPPKTKWKRLAGSLNRQAKFVSQDYSRRRKKIIDQILAGKHDPAEPLPDYQSPPLNLPIATPLPSYGGEPIYQNASHPGDLIRTLKMVPENPKADTDRLIRSMLPLAFRRPVSKKEADRYVAFVHSWLDEGVPFEAAMRTGYKAIFTSPSFLFHQSSLPEVTVVDDYALAERLAYFLWNSSPDRELIRLAKTGQLSQLDVLWQQTERLLNDERSQRFVEDFLGQWLDLHEIDFTSPDLALFPEYDPVLHWSMTQESYTFFRHLIDHDLPAINLIDSDFVTINRRLAEHYAISGVTGMKPRPVKLPADSVRGGVMTQASVLKVTANGSNTSPVVRGVWILERIRGTPPPPPPPGVPAVEPDIRGAVTIREQLEKHRSDSACAACHAIIDPPGVALESFDPVGRFRERYRVLNPKLADLKPGDQRIRYEEGLPVDPAYELSDNHRFEDIRELKQIYCGNERDIVRNFVDRLLVYATGATSTFADQSAIEEITDRTEPAEFGVRTIIHQVVQSQLFRQR